MSVSLNPRFKFVRRPSGQSYVISDRGDVNVINMDAMTMLTERLAETIGNSKYTKFYESARAQNWVVYGEPGPAEIIDSTSVDHLKRVQMEITLRCNLECAHCYCSSSPKAAWGMKTDALIRLFDEAADMGVLFFDITGGEPLLRPDIDILLGHLRKRKMAISLFTNGTFLTQEIVDRLKTHRIRYMQVSLDALTPELHDSFRGRKGSWAKTVDGIRLLKKNGLNVSVTVVAHRGNRHELKELVSFLSKDLGVSFGVDRVIPSGRTLENDNMALSSSEFYEAIFELSREDRRVSKVCDQSIGHMDKRDIEPFCGVGRSYLFIKHNGDVVMCPTMTEAESPEFKAGSLTEASLRSIWENDPTFVRFRRMQCENITRGLCDAAESCRGGCRSNAYLLHGRINSPDEFNCNMSKNDEPTYRNFIVEYTERDARAAS